MSWFNLLKIDILPAHQIAMNESMYEDNELIFMPEGRGEGLAQLITDGTYLTIDDWNKYYKKDTPKDRLMVIEKLTSPQGLKSPNKGYFGLKYHQDSDEAHIGKTKDSWAIWTDEPFTYYFYPQNRMFQGDKELTKDEYFKLLGIEDDMQERLQ